MRGHVRERGKGNWYAVLSIRDPQTGKRKVKWHSLPGCTVKKQAETECRRILHQIDGGTYVDVSKITVAEFLDRWQRDYADVKVSPKTRERYAQLIKNQIKPNIGQLQLQKLRPIHLTELYAKLLKDELAPRTVNHVHRLLHQALSQAGAWELVKQNVASLVDAPRAQAAEIVILAPEQVATVLKRSMAERCGRSLLWRSRPVPAAANCSRSALVTLIRMRKRSALNARLNRPNPGCA